MDTPVFAAGRINRTPFANRAAGVRVLSLVAVVVTPGVFFEPTYFPDGVFTRSFFP